jgi:hypothetical protein
VSLLKLSDAPRTKRCFKCGEVKSLSDFYRHLRMADGHVNKCKECNKKDVTDNRTAKLDYYREYDRERGSRQTLEDLQRYRKENPKKYAAHTALNNAVRDGLIFRTPCEECLENDVVGHHDDYDKPLVVRWLCQAHHVAWHKENGEGLNAH